MKKIKCDLSLSGTRSIQNAINEVELYTKDLVAKVNLFTRRLGAVGIATVESRSKGNNFPTSFVVDSIGQGLFRGTLLVGGGEELLFFEFGTGIKYNSTPSNHPEGARLGMTIGGYGKGYGNLLEWKYYDDSSGRWIPTSGQPAQMPVYMAYVEIISRFERIAKEVFLV